MIINVYNPSGQNCIPVRSAVRSAHTSYVT